MTETIDNSVAVSTEQITDMDREINFMGAPNFVLSPMKKMEMVWASAIIGEPQYYRAGTENHNTMKYNEFMIFNDYAEKTSEEIFLSSLQDALEYDFEGVLRLASKLRNEYLMRLGPQIILVEASLHPSRKIFNEKNPLFFRNIAKEIIQLPTDIHSQLDYYLKKMGGKSKLPGILKRCWRDVFEKLSLYQANKYLKKAHIIDIIRLSHPRSRQNEIIKQLVENGKVDITDNEMTWEKLRSEKKSWREIISILKTRFPHMALLRNLRNIAHELKPSELISVLHQLEKGVENGRQFPFRYYTAYQLFNREPHIGTEKKNMPPQKPKKGAKGWQWKLYEKKKQGYQQTSIEDVEEENLTMEELRENYKNICVSLENCMKKSLSHLAELDGYVVSLCDNSGSAWGTFNSTYGSQTVATIGNLSGLLAALRSTKGGMVGVFGDRLEMYQVSKEKGILKQLDEINYLGKTVGGSTENGIWLWFKKAYHEASLYKNVDHLFIYSDMQAGHGELYGTNVRDYEEFSIKGNYIDVIKLIERHRLKVNDKLNVFTVQTAGYDNSIIPELLPRSCIMTGWTGNEINYAARMIQIWDLISQDKV